MHSHHIRAMVPKDAEEASRLGVQLGYPASPAAIRMRIAALLASPRHCLLVAEIDAGSLAGWISAERRLLMIHDERVEITGLVVDDGARNKGVGRELVRAVERWSADGGTDTVLVRSNVVREGSHLFYACIGYARTKTQHVYRRHLAAASPGRN